MLTSWLAYKNTSSLHHSSDSPSSQQEKADTILWMQSSAVFTIIVSVASHVAVSVNITAVY